MKFREIQVGQTFDFIGPIAMFNSFYKRVIKTSTRKYEDQDGTRYEVGSINCEVHHVGSVITVEAFRTSEINTL
jgi:hypothetical protein